MEKWNNRLSITMNEKDYSGRSVDGGGGGGVVVEAAAA